MSNKRIIEELMAVLANTYSLYMKTQNYHWNVEGPHFKPLHDLFEEQYTEMADAIDETAEHIRFLGEKVDGRLAKFDEISTLNDPDHTLNADGMIKDLVDSHAKLIDILNNALELADDIDDDVLEDFFIQRLQTHRKAKWFLESSL